MTKATGPKQCPHCEINAYSPVQLELLFGWRTWRGKQIPQSRCHACRNCRAPTCSCRRLALERHAARLERSRCDLRALARRLSYKETDRGRLGKALEEALGLRRGDSSPDPDWRGRIELKIVPLMPRPGLRRFRVKDKVFICTAASGSNPVDKIRHSLFVAYDYSSGRVVLVKQVRMNAARLARLEGARRRKRKTTAHGDPMFLNTKYAGSRKAYAWYLSRPFVEELLL